jgi:serine phosphatase RsbU (regulator of sigma subunit)/Tfp pilus assembly protein PilF
VLRSLFVLTYLLFVSLTSFCFNANKSIKTFHKHLRQDIEIAKFYADSLNRASAKINDDFLSAVVYYYYSKIEIEKGNYENAQSYIHKCLIISEKNDFEELTIRCYNTIVSIFIVQKDYARAKEILSKIILRAQKTKNTDLLADISYSYATYFIDVGDSVNSKKYLQSTLKYYFNNKDYSGLSNLYSELGHLYYDHDKFEDSFKKFKQAEKFAILTNYSMSLIRIYNNIGLCFWELGNKDSAIFYLQKSINLSYKVGVKNTLPSNYENLSAVFEDKKEYEKALYFHKKYSSLNDSINSSEKTRIIKSINEKYEGEKKEAEISNLETQRNFTIASVILAILILAFVWRQNKLILAQKKIVETQKILVEKRNRETLDSISYAKYLQEAILPKPKEMNKFIKDYFIFYLPKDIVAGDFYWFFALESNPSKFLIAAADCTGHGVPGAMVSVVCANALNRCVKEFGLTLPGKILDKTTELVLETFENSENQIKDGMDISLALIDVENSKLFWAGANSPLWILRSANNQLQEFKPNKQPVASSDNPILFTTQEIDIEKNDTIYLFTDGYVDQIGGEKGKKLMKKTLREIVLSLAENDIQSQHKIITDSFFNWKKQEEQVDDICFIGIKI